MKCVDLLSFHYSCTLDVIYNSTPAAAAKEEAASIEKNVEFHFLQEMHVR